MSQKSHVLSPSASLSQQVMAKVRESTHGRIRNLAVEEEEQGRFVVRGRVSSQHARQLALKGALEVLSGEQCKAQITVG